MTPCAPDPADRVPLLLTVPGLCCSGPDHWQSLWEQTRDDCRRIGLPDWDDPAREPWIVGIDPAVARAGEGAGAGAGAPLILVAYSLGCLGVAWWAARARPESLRHVAGALLVAPPDVDRRDADPRLTRFAPTPLRPRRSACRLRPIGGDGGGVGRDPRRSRRGGAHQRGIAAGRIARGPGDGRAADRDGARRRRIRLPVPKPASVRWP